MRKSSAANSFVFLPVKLTLVSLAVAASLSANAAHQINDQSVGAGESAASTVIEKTYTGELQSRQWAFMPDSGEDVILSSVDYRLLDVGATQNNLVGGVGSIYSSKVLVNNINLNVEGISSADGTSAPQSSFMGIFAVSETVEVSRINVDISKIDYLGLNDEDNSENQYAGLAVTGANLDGSAIKVGHLNEDGSIDSDSGVTVRVTDEKLSDDDVTAQGNGALFALKGVIATKTESAEVYGTNVLFEDIRFDTDISGVAVVGVDLTAESQARVSDTKIAIGNVSRRAGSSAMFHIQGADIKFSAPDSESVSDNSQNDDSGSVLTADIRNTDLLLNLNNTAEEKSEGITPLYETYTEGAIIRGVKIDSQEVNHAQARVSNTNIVFSGFKGALDLIGVEVTSDTAAIDDTFVSIDGFSGGPFSKEPICGVKASVTKSAAIAGTHLMLSDATYTGMVIGAYVDTAGVKLNPIKATLDNNTVVLIDSKVEGDVYAAYLVQNGNDTLSATGNSVRLYNSTVSGTVGGAVVSMGPEKLDKGNSIHAEGVNTVGALEGFDTLTLRLAKENLTSHVLTVTGAPQIIQSVEDAPKLDLKNRTLVLENYTPGENYKLIHTGGGAIAVDDKTRVEGKSTFVDYTWTFDKAGTLQGLDASTLADATLTKAVTGNAKTLAESFLGSVALVNQGAEFIADEGLQAAVSAAKAGSAQAFAAVQGGSSRYNTGSHVDLDALSFAFGTSVKVSDETVLAGFIEYGSGNSESHVSGTTGEGDHRYFGLGVALQHGFENGVYMNGSARLGRSETEFSGEYASDLATYESDALYGSAHLGLGWKTPVTENVAADLYGRYTVTWTDSDKVNLTDFADSEFALSTTTAHALRVGARLTGTARDIFTWKTGLAYEHVAGADAESSVNGTAISAPTLEGDTGIAELGVAIKPTADSKWSFDLGVKGYVGDREGLSGNLMIRRVF